MRAATLAILLLLLAPSCAAQAAPTDATPPPPGPDGGTQPAGATPPADQPAPGTNGSPDATPPQPAAQDFTSQGHDFAGGWLTFHDTGTAFAVESVAYANATFLTNLSLNASTPTPSEADATYTLDAPEAAVSFQDAGSATIETTAHADTRVTLQFVEGITASLADPTDLHIELDGRALDIHGSDNATLAWDEGNRTLNVTLPPGEGLEMRFTTLEGETAQPASQAFENGTLGGEVVVDQQRAIAVDHGTTHVTASRTSNETIVIVSSTSHQARVIMITLQPGAFASRDLTVLLDGAPIQEASTVREAFDAANLTRPEFLIVSGRAETQVVVALPHLSTHTIQVQSVGEVVQRVVRDPRAPLVLAGVVATTILLAIGLVRTRR